MGKPVKGLRVTRGERYALLPREVMESAAYHATPHYARSVLEALMVQYYGQRNGSLALPVEEAGVLGVAQPWRVYAGLRILADCDLIVCTRRGGLSRGGKLASMFALTWRGIDEPADGVVYDAGVKVCPIPTHAWSRWIRADGWDAVVRDIERRARGKTTKNPVTPRSGTDRTLRSGTESVNLVPPSRVRKASLSVPPTRVTSKISVRGSGSPSASSVSHAHSSEKAGVAKIEKLLRVQSHLTDADVAKICHESIELVQRVRESLR